MSDSNEIYSSTEEDNKTQVEETLSPPNHNNYNNTAEVDHPNRLPSITDYDYDYDYDYFSSWTGYGSYTIVDVNNKHRY